MEMKIVVTGTREQLSPTRQDKIRSIMDRYDGHHTLIHGGCTGVDTYCAHLAGMKGWEVIEEKADWSLGRRAGPLRNKRMIDKYISDIVLAFPSSSSIGTRNCIDIAESRGIEVVETGL